MFLSMQHRTFTDTYNCELQSSIDKFSNSDDSFSLTVNIKHKYCISLHLAESMYQHKGSDCQYHGQFKLSRNVSINFHALHTLTCLLTEAKHSHTKGKRRKMRKLMLFTDLKLQRTQLRDCEAFFPKCPFCLITIQCPVPAYEPLNMCLQRVLVTYLSVCILCKSNIAQLSIKSCVWSLTRVSHGSHSP